MSGLCITGCNAITKKGELVNADGDGNRVAAQIFGPKKVLLVVSKNKIVESVKEGFGRIRGVAAPKNIERMNAKAISMGKEPRYNEEISPTSLPLSRLTNQEEPLLYLSLKHWGTSG